MADDKLLQILHMGVEEWNVSRQEYARSDTPDLTGADLGGLDLSRADFINANLARAGLAGATIIFGRLCKANLHNADLTNAVLTNADLTGADLSGAKLFGANLRGADLRGADLTGADLYKVDLTGADLAETEFEGSTFGFTVLSNIDLSGAEGLESVKHYGPSEISISTVYRSEGHIPEVFLRGCGVPENFFTYMGSLTAKALDFYSCFISYSHHDKSFARRLHDALQGRGIRCWLDEHQLKPGDKIHREVDRGIRLWDKVLLCCSKESLRSWWVNNEIEMALEKEQQLLKDRGIETLALIPLNLDGYLLSGEWRSGYAAEIRSRLAADFTGWKRSVKKFDTQFEHLVKALRADGGREAPPAPKL